MASIGNSSVESKKCYRGISTALAAAVLEWLLICMLFIDALFSYLITIFASACKLQVPCLLCSRLDHILGNRKLKYYWDLICRNHKLEISSLVLCHAHNNLVDVRGMCESCLFSFATINKSNAETYRLLVGKLGEESSFDLNEDPLLENLSTRNCSCCNQPWIPRGCGRKLMQTISIGSEAADLDARQSGSIRRDQESPKKVKRFVSIGATNRKRGQPDPLSHVVYSELKIDSDTESEVLFSDDDHTHTLIREVIPEEDDKVEDMQREPHDITLLDGSASEKLINTVSASVPVMQSDVTEAHRSIAVASKVEIGHGLEELNWEHYEVGVLMAPKVIPLDEVPPSPVPELMSHDGVPPSSIDIELPLEESEESKHTSVDDVPQPVIVAETVAEASVDNEPISVNDIAPLAYAQENEALVQESRESKLISLDHIRDTREAFDEISKDSKLIFPVDVLPSLDIAETPVQESKESCETRPEEVWQASETECEKICEAVATTETASETNPVLSDNGPQASNVLDLGDAYKLAIDTRGRQLSGVLVEQWIGKDSSRLSEDLKHLLSQLSAAREQSLSDTSPRVAVSPKLSFNADELKTSDASNVIGMQILQKRISLERNESGISLDGSLVSEIEGESVADRLKRQVDHDKKLLGALYKELEEERNASAIAANQAMAMITRLQEEKAMLQMEALQCVRMMEEQAEYDIEALQKTNDLLAEKEKEIQDLEAELEFYRNNFLNESTLEDKMESVSEAKTADIRLDYSDARSDTCPEVEDKDVGTVGKSVFEFEDERLYILRSLEKLEKKLYLFSNNGVYLDTANSEYPENGDMLNDKGNELVPERVSSLENPELVDKQKTTSFHGGKSTDVSPEGIDLDSLVNEVCDLNKRVEALEADRIFLEHSVNSIRSGEEGLRFIQDIASQLKELRKIGVRVSENSVAQGLE